LAILKVLVIEDIVNHLDLQARPRSPAYARKHNLPHAA
jgi:hypothetical protein